VDTTGCGVAINTGVHYGVLMGCNIVRAGKLGSLLVTYKATGYSTQYPSRNLKELLDLEENYKNLK